MQGSLSSPQRLCLQSLAALQSYRTFGVNPVGLCSFLRWQALEKPQANNGVANDLPLLETVKAKGAAFAGSRNMAGTSFASTPSCSYKTDVTPCDFNRTIAASGKLCGSVQKFSSSCGIPKPVQRLVALQWVSLHTQREYDRKPVTRVAGKTGGQDVLVKEEKFEFKRIVSESDSITMFYSSDFSSSSEDEEDEKKTKVAIENATDSHRASDTDVVKGLDPKKAKKLKSLQKTESDMRDCESEDEKEEILTKEDKKIAKAELKQREKLEKEGMKAMKKDQKKKTKDAKKLVSEGKKDDESDSDSESDEEGAQRSREKTKTVTKLKADEDLASDSENGEADDGVTDFVDDDSEEENLRITESELNDYVKNFDISDEFEKELDDEDEDIDIDEDEDFWEDDDGDVVVGDGGAGGGVVLGGTKWGTNALDLAEQVVAEYGKDISIFSFKVSSDRVIRVRLDKLSDRYGSPTMTDIETFSRKFSTALEESGEAGNVPKDIDVEVSSPGAERVVRVPDDLQRFKKLPMYVQYLEGETDQDGVFELDSVDMDAGLSVWKIANVKLNREVKGRGRPLNNKQKKWRATVPFAALKQVRLYLDV